MNGIYLYFVNNIILDGCYWDFNLLANKTILDYSKLKAFADIEVCVTQKIELCYVWDE